MSVTISPSPTSDWRALTGLTQTTPDGRCIIVDVPQRIRGDGRYERAEERVKAASAALAARHDDIEAYVAALRVAVRSIEARYVSQPTDPLAVPAAPVSVSVWPCHSHAGTLRVSADRDHARGSALARKAGCHRLRAYRLRGQWRVRIGDKFAPAEIGNYRLRLGDPCIRQVELPHA